MQNTKRTFYTLDALRGLAAITVVLYHFTYYTSGNGIFPAGQLAVDLFYCLSGFVICHTYEQRMKDGLTLPTFLKIRWIRFYPYYLLGALLGIGQWILFRLRKDDVVAHSVTVKTFIISVATSLFFLPSSGLTTVNADDLFPFNFPAWSLFLELAVNIVYIGLIYRLSISKLGIVVTALALMLAACIFHYHSSDIGFAHSSFFGGVSRATFSFFAGVLLRRIWKPEFSAKGSYLWLPTVFLLCISIPRNPIMQPYIDLFIICMVIPYLVFLGAVLERGNEQVGSTFRTLGKSSYGLYTLHVPLIATFVTLAPSKFSSLGPRVSVMLGLIATTLLIMLVRKIDTYYDMPLRARLRNMLLAAPVLTIPPLYESEQNTSFAGELTTTIQHDVSLN